MQPVTLVQTPPPQREALSVRTREAIMRRILTGGFAPGERLIEMRLAQEMGTSQSPIREALRELEALGLVETSRNRGTRVRATDPEELAEIYAVRAELESYAAGLAAPRLAGTISVLEDAHRAMTETAVAGDPFAFGEANARFHGLIMEASGNGTLLDIWRRLDVRSRATVNIIRMGRDLKAIAQSHLPILRAIASGRPEAARRAARAHILGYRPKVTPAERRDDTP